MFKHKFFNKKLVSGLFTVALLFCFSISSTFAASVPTILSFQGRLADSSGNLLGGAGTNYYFKFSIWNNATVGLGSQLWPAVSPSSFSTTVRQGVFNVNIGDTSAGYPDVLNYNFNANNPIYLQVEVSSDNVSFQTLGPRQKITSAAFSQVAGAVSGAGQSSFGTTTPINDSVVSVVSTSTNSTALTIRGFLGQVANLFQIQNSAGTNLFAVDNNGLITANSANFSGEILATNFSGTSTGINTGDESSSTIRTKLGSASSTNDGYLSATDWITFSSGLSTTSANALYINYSYASSTFPSFAYASNTFLTINNAVANYVSTSSLTSSLSVYLSTTTASSTYAKLLGADFTGPISAPNFSGTSTGVNTGDESSSSIRTKLGSASSINDGYLSASNWTTFSGMLSTTTASSTYLTIANATSTYLTYSYASSTYASTTYLNNNFPTFTYASSTYLTLAASTSFARLDGTNQPFTGNINIATTSPELRLTDGNYTRLVRTSTLNQVTLYNKVAFFGTYTTQTFTSNGTATIPAGVSSVEVLAVGGGGGGNTNSAGGGGGGQVIDTTITITPGTYSVVVGAGGTNTYNNPTSGTSSSFASITAIGGNYGIIGPNTGTGGTSGNGYLGGNGAAMDGGGGGGASQNGYNGVGGQAGKGGDGLSSSISGTATYYGGGGGGGGYTPWGDQPGAGGLGGGGAGGGGGVGTNGTANTGGGGGGGAGGNAVGGTGGSGIVILKYANVPTIEEISLINSQDSTVAGEKGVNTFGSSLGVTHLNGNALYFDINGTTKLKVDSNGNLGIGTSTPSQALTVAGNIYTTGTITASNFSGTSTGVNTGDESSSSIRTKLGSASSTNDGYLSATDWITFSSGLSTTSANALYINYSYASSTFPSFAYASSTFASTSWVLGTFASTTYVNNNFPTFTYASSSYLLAVHGSYITDLVGATKVTTENVANEGAIRFWLPLAGVNLVPIMTSATTPSGVVTASSYYDGSYVPFNAFDNNINSIWHTSSDTTNAHWIQYQFPIANVVNTYVITPRQSNGTGTWKNWQLWASNSGSADSSTSTYTLLDTETGQDTHATNADKTYAFTNTATYSYYKFIFTDRPAYASVARITLTGSPTPVERMTFVNNNLGIGTSTPSYPLTIVASSNGQIELQDTAGTAGDSWIIGDNSSDYFQVYNQDGNGVYMTNGGTSWTANSDVRLKTNITTLGTSTLDKILALNPVTFNWIATSSSQVEQVGFIAQEVESAGFGDLVVVPKNPNDCIAGDPNNSDCYGLDYDRFAPYLVKAIQEQQGIINDNIATTSVIKNTIGGISASSSLIASDLINIATILGIDLNSISTTSTPILTLLSGQTSIINELSSTTAELASTANNLETRITALENNLSLNLNVLSLGGLSVSGNTILNGGLQVDNVNSIGNMLNLNSNVAFFGRPYFNTDTAGFAIIHDGQQSVDVTFTNPYLEQPIVNVSITMNDLSDEANLTATVDSIFNNNVQYVITRKSTNGFSIILNKPATEDINFSWTVFAVKGAKTFDVVSGTAQTQTNMITGSSTKTILATSTDITSDTSATSTDKMATSTATSTNFDDSPIATSTASSTPDTTPPKITIIGGNPVLINVGDTYADAGATAVDDIDGTVSVLSSGTVDIATTGTYVITYNATDTAENIATAIRTVNVNAVVSTSTATTTFASSTAS